jgi:hypothetical protein
MRLHNNDNDTDHNDQNYPYEPNEPNEPYEPGEPSEVPITLDVKYIYNENNYTGLNNSLKNESIENKLKALLEATETETTS